MLDTAYELYRNTLYCNPEKQALPSRPRQWYSTKRGHHSHLSKFSWVSCPEITFESSFQSAHDPFHIEWLETDRVIQMRYDNYRFPFGVKSYLKDNKLFWRNCALSYLVKYNHAYLEEKEFQALVDGWDASEGDTPQHLLDIVAKAKEAKRLNKAKFKTARRYEKENFGLIRGSELPKLALNSINPLSRLNAYLKHFPHNSIIAYQSVESFYKNGFEKLSKRAFHTEESMTHAIAANCADSFSILVAYIKECCIEPKFKKDEQGKIIGAELVEAYEEAMNLRLCFGKDYGSFNQLNAIKRLSDRYNDIQDVTTWFKGGMMFRDE